jgi:hypothetical protein
MRIFVILISLFVIACGAPPLRPDPVPIAAPDANAYTAEFRAAGMVWHGAAVLPIRRGRPISDLQISVQGYHEGVISVYSSACDIQDSVNYRGSALVPISSDLIPSTGCAIGFYVTPKYKSEENQSVIIRSFKGLIRLRLIDDQDAFAGYVSQIPMGSDAEISLPSDIDTVVVMRGGQGACEISTRDNEIFSPFNGSIKIRLSQISLKTDNIKTCVISGFYNKSREQVVFNWLVAVHSSRYSHLPTPSTSFDRKLSVFSDPAASILSVGSSYIFGINGEFSAQNGDIVRALTVSGRSRIGVFSDGNVSWIPFNKNYLEAPIARP